MDDPPLATVPGAAGTRSGRRPGAIAPLTDALVPRIDRLIDGVVVDPEAPIEGDVAL